YNFNGIQHFTIIEDAQYFAPQDLMKKSKITTYLEDIALLQRGTGECLITLATRPDISKEILANNGVVLTFKNHIEKDIMCELLNIDNENRNFLSILEEGQCIIRVNSIKEPFLLKIPLIKHESLTIAEIKNKNQSILKNNTDSCPSVSILKKNILQVYVTKIGVKISKLFSLKPKRKENNSSGVVDKHSQNNLLTKNTIPKKIIPQSSLNVKSYNKLETYINHLYKLQKKKE
ncbi:MAG: ATP-binding protein, partial [Candidatus Lokiarchaeota archaeon]|nr:ATP-binding protein [Candidatus Lokiarchaeota archaeon]